MEVGVRGDQCLILLEDAASPREDRVQVGERGEVAVDDGFVDERPEALGGLQLRAVGGRKTSRMPSGTASPGSVCQPALSSTRTMMRSRPAPACRAKAASNLSKNRLSVPFDRRSCRVPGW